MSENTRYSTDIIVCPWCGYEHTQQSWEMGDGDHDCAECEKPFEVSSYAAREITTTRKEVKHDNALIQP